MSARQERKARKERQKAGEEVFVHIKPQKRQIKHQMSNRQIKAYIKKYDPKISYESESNKSTPTTPAATA